MQLKTFPDFGKELHRAFAVAERCYDCAKLYGGCKAWPQSRPFPASRVSGCAAGGDAAPEQKAAREDSPHTDEACETARPKAGTRGETVKPDRRCGCGEPLPKHKRLCDRCRTDNRRQTRRQYMREYMRQCRSGELTPAQEGRSVLSNPVTMGSSGDDLPFDWRFLWGCAFRADFCITERSPAGGQR